MLLSQQLLLHVQKLERSIFVVNKILNEKTSLFSWVGSNSANTLKGIYQVNVFFLSYIKISTEIGVVYTQPGRQVVMQDENVWLWTDRRNMNENIKLIPLNLISLQFWSDWLKLADSYQSNLGQNKFCKEVLLGLKSKLKLKEVEKCLRAMGSVKGRL